VSIPPCKDNTYEKTGKKNPSGKPLTSGGAGDEGIGELKKIIHFITVL
jgi:hypothetical protein